MIIVLPAVLAGLIGAGVRAAAVRGVAAAAGRMAVGRGLGVAARAALNPVRAARVKAAYRLRKMAKSDAERKAISRAYNLKKGGGTLSTVDKRREAREKSGDFTESGFKKNANILPSMAQRASDQLDKMAGSTLNVAKAMDVMGRVGATAMGAAGGLVAWAMRLPAEQYAASVGGARYSGAQAYAAEREYNARMRGEAKVAKATEETAKARGRAAEEYEKAAASANAQIGNYKNRIAAQALAVKTAQADYVAGFMKYGPQSAIDWLNPVSLLTGGVGGVYEMFTAPELRRQTPREIGQLTSKLSPTGSLLKDGVPLEGTIMAPGQRIQGISGSIRYSYKLGKGKLERVKTRRGPNAR